MIRNSNSTDKEYRIQYLESGIYGEESRIQDCLGFAYMGRCLKGIRIPESGKRLFVDSRIRNAQYKSRNPESHYWLECGIHYLESGIQGVDSGIQDCLRFPCLEWCLHINWILKLMILLFKTLFDNDTFPVLCWNGWQGWIWIQKLEIVGPTFSSFNDMPPKTITKKLWLVLPDEVRSISSS